MSSAVREARKKTAWVVLGTTLVFAILLMVNFISARRYARWDWTSEGLFTLSERTEQVLAGLDGDVEMYLFVGSSDPLYADVKEMIDRYQARSEHVTAHYIDPDREPVRFQALADKFGMRTGQMQTGEMVAEVAAIVTAGDSRWSINKHDLVSVDEDAFGLDPSEAKVDVKTEQALTGALVQVTSGRATRVCVANGHGEWTLDGAERSLYTAQVELKRENIEFAEVEVRGRDSIEDGCDALWVIGPLKPIPEEDANVMKRYVEGGGNLLLALDPILDGGQLLHTGMEAVLGDWGIKSHNDVVVELERDQMLSSKPGEQFLVIDWGDHPTVRPLSILGAPAVMHLARSFSVAEGDDVSALMRTSQKAYGETDLNALAAGDDYSASPEDIVGPLVLAAAVDTRPAQEGDKDEPGGRVIVVGDSEWLNDQLLQARQFANIDLLSSWTGWLTQREALVSIAPRKIDAIPVLITEDALTGLFLRVILMMPLAAIILGVGIWWQRRA